jgi:hypothetical protein
LSASMNIRRKTMSNRRAVPLNSWPNRRRDCHFDWAVGLFQECLAHTP